MPKTYSPFQQTVLGSLSAIVEFGMFIVRPTLIVLTGLFVMGFLLDAFESRRLVILLALFVIAWSFDWLRTREGATFDGFWLILESIMFLPIFFIGITRIWPYLSL